MKEDTGILLTMSRQGSPLFWFLQQWKKNIRSGAKSLSVVCLSFHRDKDQEPRLATTKPPGHKVNETTAQCVCEREDVDVNTKQMCMLWHHSK